MSQSLVNHDPELFDIIEKEKSRQFRGLEMIASENFTSRAVFECLGSALTNKYAEGEVGCRYYGGTTFVDEVEALAKRRALEAFHLNPAEWGVNVQPYSGSPANFAVYAALLQPHDRIMGLSLPNGGHLTHGFYTAKKKISATSIFFESMPYHTDADGVIDYAELEKVADVYRPAMIVLGASAYPKEYDYERVRVLCDRIGCYLFMDMAHTAGLIAGGVMLSPFDHADVVTTTTHKSLRGPRSGMIFYRKTTHSDGKPTDYESRINQMVFPGLQGGPHMHQIAAIATQMKEVCNPDWKVYAQNVQKNCRALAKELMNMGYQLVGNGTDNHLLLWKLRVLGLTGSKMEKLLDKISISSNKNTIPGDKSALSPGGIRLGTCALTSRNLSETDMVVVAGFLDRAAKLGQQIQQACGAANKVQDFLEKLHQDFKADVTAIRHDVESFATKFPMPGFDIATLRYREGIPPVT